jgi:hypothetical protein
LPPLQNPAQRLGSKFQTEQFECVRLLYSEKLSQTRPQTIGPATQAPLSQPSTPCRPRVAKPTAFQLFFLSSVQAIWESRRHLHPRPSRGSSLRVSDYFEVRSHLWLRNKNAKGLRKMNEKLDEDLDT